MISKKAIELIIKHEVGGRAVYERRYQKPILNESGVVIGIGYNLSEVKDNLEFDQLIWEFGTKENCDWIHVSYESTGRQRKQVLRAVRANGKTTYQNY